jgi:Uma2 family endonuclease
MSRTVETLAKPSVVPPLQNGDQLTRAEFERRFDATPGLKKAELIEGVVFMPPPVSHTYHSNPHSHLIAAFSNYAAATPGVESGTEGSIRLDLDNMPQPDVYLIIRSAKMGQAKIDDDGYVEGAPELIAEVAASSVSFDLHKKMNVYRRSGVREYIVWRTLDREIDYFILHDGRYDRLAADASGIWRSDVFPGLWIDGKSLLAGDLATALNVVRQGLQSNAHGEFVTRLQSAR